MSLPLSYNPQFRSWEVGIGHLGSDPALREPPEVPREPKILPSDLKVCLQESKNAPPEAQNRPFEGLRRPKSPLLKQNALKFRTSGVNTLKFHSFAINSFLILFGDYNKRRRGSRVVRDQRPPEGVGARGR